MNLVEKFGDVFLLKTCFNGFFIFIFAASGIFVILKVVAFLLLRGSLVIKLNIIPYLQIFRVFFTLFFLRM